MNKQMQQTGGVATFEQAKLAVIRLTHTRGRARAVGALACLGVDNLTQLHPSRYGTLVEVCQRIEHATSGVQS